MPRRKTTTFHNLFMLNPAPTKRLLAMCNSWVPIVFFFEIQSMRVANYANCRSRMLCASLVSNKHKPPFWQSHPRSRPGRICLADSCSIEEVLTKNDQVLGPWSPFRYPPLHPVLAKFHCCWRGILSPWKVWFFEFSAGPTAAIISMKRRPWISNRTACGSHTVSHCP